MNDTDTSLHQLMTLAANRAAQLLKNRAAPKRVQIQLITALLRIARKAVPAGQLQRNGRAAQPMTASQQAAFRRQLRADIQEVYGIDCTPEPPLIDPGTPPRDPPAPDALLIDQNP
jgi:hypothetical protein